jgi:hypothetical protein
LSDESDFGALLGFTPAWYALGIVDEEFLARARVRWDKGEDDNTEHYRYGAFREFLAAHRPLSSQLAVALYELGAADADQGMGEAMMVDIVFQPGCPEVVLAAAAASGRRSLVRAAERRRAERDAETRRAEGSNQQVSLAEILASIEQAVALLSSAERAWPGAVESESASAAFVGAAAPEVPAIEELLHVATHETANTLALTLQDIQSLLARLRIRAKYKMFSHEQFDKIASRGWSTSLVSELHKQHPEISLVELSALVKGLCAQWGRLPRVMHSAVSL